jgi:ribosome biogenesis protein Nip4
MYYTINDIVENNVTNLYNFTICFVVNDNDASRCFGKLVPSCSNNKH